MVAGALSADHLGFGGRSGLGVLELILLAVGLWLLGIRSWSDAPVLGVRRVIVLTTWLGCLGGLVDAAIYASCHYGFGWTMHQTPELLWMSPACHAALMFGYGLVLAAAGRVWPRANTVPAALFVPVMVMGWAKLTETERLEPYATILLSAGIAFALVRVLGSRVDGLWRWVRRTAPWMAAAVVGTAISWSPVVGWSEARALGAQPAAKAGAPNVLLIVLDTVRADHMSLFGYRRQTTPNIDELAARGSVFDRAIATSAWTLPTHASLLTGTYHYEQSVAWTQPLDREHRMLPEVLARRGYATAAFVGNLLYCAATYGLGRGFGHYEDFQTTLSTIAAVSFLPGTLMRNSGGFLWFTVLRNDAKTVTDGFLDWLPQRGGRPFFAMLNYYDAHTIYRPRPDSKWGEVSPLTEGYYEHDRDWSDAEIAPLIDAYDGCIRHVDEQIGRVFEELRARDLLDDTMVVVTSDHGEQFGENRLMEHGNSLYRPLLHVPLIFVWPGHVSAGARIRQPVSLRDVPATILGLADIELPEPFFGHSLAPYLTRPDAPADTPRSAVLSEVGEASFRASYCRNAHGDMQSLVEGTMHLIVNHDGTKELYDMAVDPREENNLIEQRAGVAARMHAALRAVLSR